jgi:hypothetical protein
MMLFVGGVSFFVMLATFPGLMLLVGLYGMVSTPEAAADQAQGLAALMPSGARDLLAGELQRLAHAPVQALSAQSGMALLVAIYAAHRGFKALIAGLSFVHGDDAPSGLVRFNLLALGVLAAAFVLLPALSVAFLALQFAARTLGLEVGSEGAEVVQRLGRAEFFGLLDREVLGEGDLFDGGHSRLQIPASWLVGLRDHANDGVFFRGQKSLESGRADFARAAKNDSHGLQGRRINHRGHREHRGRLES